MCVESNLIEVPFNSWWFYTGYTIHIKISLHGFQKQKDASLNCFNVFVGEGTKVEVKAIGSVRLELCSGFILQLTDVLYVPKMRRNLISTSKLVKNGFSFLGDDECLKLFMKNNFDSVLGTAKLVESLWQLECSVVLDEYHALHTSTKRMLNTDTSYILWHKRLGHISRERITKLSKSNLIPSLNFETATDCVDCFKGKLTSFRNFEAKRSKDLLEIIHTDICGPFPTKTICGNNYFVNFIDDFSRFSYTYLIS